MYVTYCHASSSFLFIFLSLCFSGLGSSLTCIITCRLYHHNPWMDTAMDECPSFHLYLSNPTSFLMQRFAGMTLPVANFLAKNVLCILDDPTDDSQRIGAREFGLWIRGLPTLIGTSESITDTHAHPRVSSTTFVYGLPLASASASHHPSSRLASAAAAGGSPPRPAVGLRAIPQNASMDPVLDHGNPGSTLPFALDHVFNEEFDDEELYQREEQQTEDSHSPSVWSLSTTKRSKRRLLGKGKTRSTLASQYPALLSELQPYVSPSSNWRNASRPPGIGEGSSISTTSSLQSYYTANTSLLSYSTNSTSAQSSNMSFSYSVTSINSRKSRKNVLYPRRVHPLPDAVSSVHSLPPDVRFLVSFCYHR